MVTFRVNDRVSVSLAPYMPYMASEFYFFCFAMCIKCLSQLSVYTANMIHCALSVVTNICLQLFE